MSVSLRPRAIHDENATRGSGAMVKPTSGKGHSDRTPMASVTKNAPATTVGGGKAGAVAPRRALGDISNSQQGLATKPTASVLKPASTRVIASVQPLQSRVSGVVPAKKRKVSVSQVSLPSLACLDEGLDADWSNDLSPLEATRGSGLLADYCDYEVEAASAAAALGANKGAALFSLARRPDSPIMWLGSSSSTDDEATTPDALLAAQLAVGPFELDGIVDDIDFHF